MNQQPPSLNYAGYYPGPTFQNPRNDYDERRSGLEVTSSDQSSRFNENPAGTPKRGRDDAFSKSTNPGMDSSKMETLLNLMAMALGRADDRSPSSKAMNYSRSPHSGNTQTHNLPDESG